MKYLVHIYKLLLFAVVILVSCSEKMPETDSRQLILKDTVQSIDEEFYFATYSFDKIVLNVKLYERYYLFDNNGNFLEFIHANVFLGQNLNDSSSFKTDSLIINDLKESEWYKPLKSEPDYIRKVYNYLNDSVYLISSFDKDNELIAYDDCRLSGGRLEQIKTYTNDDKLLSKTSYNYDNKNRLTDKSRYYEKLSYKTQYTYSLGRKYESASYSAKHSVSIFNISGLLKKMKNYIGNTHISTLYYKYDENDNLISLVEKDKLNGKEKLTTYSYKFDERGNWIEKLEKRYDGNIFVTRRQIKYY